MAKKHIVLIKKVQSHSDHRGGAWKVAYADFVTALMALFIVLWLMNTSEDVRRIVAGYFNNPLGRAAVTGTDRSGTADNLPVTKENVQQLKQRIEQAIQKVGTMKALTRQIEITVTPEGLRIELMESKAGTFFERGSAVLNSNGRELLGLIAHELKDIPNHLSIEGHTDAQPYVDPSGYGNWELSTDRANAARRLMQSTGLRSNQISQVRGYADQKLRLPQSPLDPSNRRISLIVQYLDASSATPPQSIAIPAPPTPPAPVAKPAEPAMASPASPVSGSVPVPASSPGSRIAEQLLARFHRK